MRFSKPHAAVAFLFVAALASGAWLVPALLEAPPDAVPETSFDVEGEAAADRLVVEYVDGPVFESGELAVLVYEDRPVVPDRTVHRTTWETNATTVRPGDELSLEDRRFEPGQRVVVRWFGDPGQANLYETRL